MKIAKAWEEKGVNIPAPYKRTIKVQLAPDKKGVEEVSFQICWIDPYSQTDYHIHDRPELIYVVSGKGIAVCEGKEVPVEADVTLWVEKGERHQMKNTGCETLKLATLFIPPIKAADLYQERVAAAVNDQK